MKKVILLLLFVSLSITHLYSENQKPFVGVIDLDCSDSLITESKAISHLLRSAIYNTNLVEMIDISNRSKILEELNFSLSGLADDESAVKLGQLLSANIIVFGAINQIGNIYSIDLKAIEVETSKVIGTYYDTYDSINSLLDKINEIGAKFTQNFTGQRALQIKILEYETLIPVLVSCNVEYADVSIDGVSVGKIENNQLSKVVNTNSNISIMVSADGYYSKELKIYVTEEVAVSINLLKKKTDRFELQYIFGGGVFSTFLINYYIIPNWWYIKGGFGFTPSTSAPLFSFPIIISSGSYIFLTEHNKFRIYTGGYFILNYLKYHEMYGFFIEDSRLLFNSNIGISVGAEYLLNEKWHLGLETNIFINQIFYSPINIFQLGLVVKYVL